jgi:hypothetical protein
MTGAEQSFPVKPPRRWPIELFTGRVRVGRLHAARSIRGGVVVWWQRRGEMPSRLWRAGNGY